MDNSSNTTQKYIQIELEPSEFNWIPLLQIYSFMISKESLVLFLYLYSQSRINEANSIKKYTLSNLLEAQSIDYMEFRKFISELEKHKLISIFSENETLILKLISPEAIKELLGRKDFLNTVLPEFKLAELKYSFEKYKNLDELIFSSGDIKKENKTEELQLNSKQEKIYWSFYDELYKSFEREFKLSNSIIEILEKYWIDEKETSLNLIELSIKCMRTNSDNEHYLSIIELSNLINEELGNLKKEFQIENYHQFWKSLIYKKDKKELKKQFKDLFSEYSGVTFYLKITKKKQVPFKLEAWVKECIQKDINPVIINGILSFVFSLLKKIPINYLIKMSETLINDGIHSTDQFLSHVKSVLKNESKGKNRMGFLPEEISK